MTAPPPEAPKGLRAALWAAQVVLALAFLAAALFKLATPYEKLAQMLGWVRETPVGVVKFIGVAELAGALGLVLPAATRIKPGLTPLAAAGLALDMVWAVGVHLARSELTLASVPLALGAASAFVLWGRYKRVPIPARA